MLNNIVTLMQRHRLLLMPVAALTAMVYVALIVLTQARQGGALLVAGEVALAVGWMLTVIMTKIAVRDVTSGEAKSCLIGGGIAAVAFLAILLGYSFLEIPRDVPRQFEAFVAVSLLPLHFATFFPIGIMQRTM